MVDNLAYACQDCSWFCLPYMYMVYPWVAPPGCHYIYIYITSWNLYRFLVFIYIYIYIYILAGWVYIYITHTIYGFLYKHIPLYMDSGFWTYYTFLGHIYLLDAVTVHMDNAIYITTLDYLVLLDLVFTMDFLITYGFS